MAKYKVAFIGAGGRSVCYARAYAPQEDIEVVAVADPSSDHRTIMSRMAGLDNSPAEYDDYKTMLAEHKDLHGVVISTPNYLHAEHVIACLERGLPVALEKPLAVTPGQCERIIDAERINNGRTVIGFVLRSAPFYAKIHELIAAGTIGNVVSVQADELPGWGVTNVMNRSSWRRFTKYSGGSMLEKSCHDMDIFNWMTDSRPTALASFGSRTVFTPNPSLPETCPGCIAEKTCNYYMEPELGSEEDAGEGILGKFIRHDNACIYNVDKDILDVQSVTMMYANGAVVNFMLNFNCDGPRSGRNFHAVGTRGRIWGNLADHHVMSHDNATGQTTEHPLELDASGHGGGDVRHALQLHQMMADPDYKPTANAAAGYLSAMMCFATDISVREKRFVNFEYYDDDRIVLT